MKKDEEVTMQMTRLFLQGGEARTFNYGQYCWRLGVERDAVYHVWRVLSRKRVEWTHFCRYVPRPYFGGRYHHVEVATLFLSVIFVFIFFGSVRSRPNPATGFTESHLMHAMDQITPHML